MRIRISSRAIGVVLSVAAAVLLGAGVTVVSSPASFRAPIGGNARVPPVLKPGGFPSPAVAPSPTPGPKAPGVLADRASLHRYGNTLVASGNGQLLYSLDQGLGWRPVVLPAGASGLGVDPANDKHWITGGTNVQVSADRGTSWGLPRTQPPRPGPYAPLLISPDDPDVWFFAGHGRLLRTRDGGVSWRELAGIVVTDPTQLISEPQAGSFSLLTGGSLFLLTDNGNIVVKSSGQGGVAATEAAVVGGEDPAPLLVLGSDGKDYLFKGSWSTTGPFSGHIGGAPTGAAWIAAGGTSLRQASRLAYSSDEGATWALAQGLPSDQTAEAVAALSADGRSVAVYTYGGDIYRSTDGGATWTWFSSGLRAAVAG